MRGREHHITRMYDLPEARSCLQALLPVDKPGSHLRLAGTQRRKFQGVFGGLIFQVGINHLPQSPHAPGTRRCGGRNATGDRRRTSWLVEPTILAAAPEQLTGGAKGYKPLPSARAS